VPMKTALVAVIISLLAANAIAQPPDRQPEQRDKPEAERERLGLQAGYVGTTSDLGNNFGGGFNLCLHWIQHIRHPLFVDFTLGAFYMGKTDRQDITLDLLGQNFDNTSLRIIRFTLAPLVEMPVSDRTTGYVSLGGGVYIVSLLLDEAFQEFDLTNNHFGISVGAGVAHQITQNWFVEFHAELHKMWTSTASDDIFYRYSDGDKNPLFYQAAVGVLLRLF
jgi:opacity protein-like surface antigen